MVNFDKIATRFDMIGRYLDVLRHLSLTEREAYLADPVLIGSMRYYLQVSIECCLDVASHVISSERFRAPKDYADTFSVLEEEKIITPNPSSPSFRRKPGSRSAGHPPTPAHYLQTQPATPSALTT